MSVPRIENPPKSRRLRMVLLLGLLCVPLPAVAASSSFDLVGPRLAVTVTHGGVTLPLNRVPNLAEGDRLAITLDLLPGSHERYRLVAGFLRGSVDRPPDDWFHEARSWKPKSATLSLTVPKGAQQLALFIAPESGGGAKAIVGTIRKQPGAFVRAVQELNQASLDRARLDTFLIALQAAERKDPESVASVSPILTRSLAIKLKAECLLQPAQAQAGCLTGDRETLLLADSHSSALADTVTGTPTDLALQLSATPQAGYGAYSSYIGVVRDVFRLFGAFQSTQLQFIPALSQMGDGRVTVLLNTPLSFARPSSVMVVALPVVEASNPPPLRSTALDRSLCAAPGLVLPVEGAPLVYATGYARDLALRFTLADGTQGSVPVRADPGVGGFVLDGPFPANGMAPAMSARLHGKWGFAPFDGPIFTLTRPDAGSWSAVEPGSLVVGRDNALALTGDGVGCVTQVAMRGRDGGVVPLSWKQAGPRTIVATVPLDKAAPGPVSIVIDGIGRTTPSIVTVTAVQETGSLDGLTVHAAEQDAVLTGTRLDQVTAVTLGGAAFRPGVLTRVGGQDSLTLRTPDAVSALTVGRTVTADIAFTSGRHRTLAVTVAPQRAGVSLVRVMAQAPERPGVPITLPADLFAQDARISFAFHASDGAMLTGRETIEIATTDGGAVTQIQAGKGYDLQDVTTGIVAFTPAEALGPLGYGPLRFRVVHDGDASRWSPLATIVRLPDLRRLTCLQGQCTLMGERLFLIKSVSTTEDFRTVQDLPDGFVASSIAAGPSLDGRLFLRLRDAPQAVASVAARH